MSLSLRRSSVWAVFELSHGGTTACGANPITRWGQASWRKPDAVTGLPLLLPQLPGGRRKP